MTDWEYLFWSICLVGLGAACFGGPVYLRALRSSGGAMGDGDNAMVP